MRLPKAMPRNVKHLVKHVICRQKLCFSMNMIGNTSSLLYLGLATYFVVSYACIRSTFHFSSSYLFWNSLCSSYQVLSPVNFSLLIASKVYSVYHYCKGGKQKIYKGEWIGSEAGSRGFFDFAIDLSPCSRTWTQVDGNKNRNNPL